MRSNSQILQFPYVDGISAGMSVNFGSMEPKESAVIFDSTKMIKSNSLSKDHIEISSVSSDKEYQKLIETELGFSFSGFGASAAASYSYS